MPLKVSTAKKATAKKAPGTRPSTRARGTSPSPKRSCFVISPFGDWYEDYHEHLYSVAIKDAGLTPTRTTDLFRSSNIVNDIWSFITDAAVLLADLTGKNPNVFYELGLAHAAKKPVVLITENMDDVPFDLRGLRVHEYTPRLTGWDTDLRAKIRASLLETLESPSQFVLPTFLQISSSSEPTVTADELRFLRLEQDMASLRAQVRTETSVRSIALLKGEPVYGVPGVYGALAGPDRPDWTPSVPSLQIGSGGYPVRAEQGLVRIAEDTAEATD